MMRDQGKKQVTDRLKRIGGQVQGLQKMINEDRYCIDVLNQMASVASALRAVENIVIKQHLATCVADALSGGDSTDKKEKIDELMAVLSKFRKHG